MANSLYITTVTEKSGKSVIVLGLMALLLRDIRKVGFFRPIIKSQPEGKMDHDINLIKSHFNLELDYDDMYAVDLNQAKMLIHEGRHSELMKIILNQYQQLQEKCDFVLIEGTDFEDGHESFNSDIDAAIAENLGCPAITISNGKNHNVEEIVSISQLAIDTLSEKGVDTMGVIVNRADKSDKEAILKALSDNINIPNGVAYVIPEEKALSNPTMLDVLKWLDAQVIYGRKYLDKKIDNVVVAAMQVSNFLNYIQEGDLIVTSNDRPDIILASMASRISTGYPNVSGIVLTGGKLPPKSIEKLVEGWHGIPVPVLLTKDSTYPTVDSLHKSNVTIDPKNKKKISSALGLFDTNIQRSELKEKLISHKSKRITPQMFEYKLIGRARKNKQHIVLPEGIGERILNAADILLRRDVCDITLLGKEELIKNKISTLGLSLPNVNIIEPSKSPLFDDYVEEFYQLRKVKGITRDNARDAISDETYFGTMMTHKGDADGMVSGSRHTTAHTIRPAFQIIKTKPGASVVSSVFLMCLKDKVLVFGDCAIITNPTAEELAEVAIASAETAKTFGIEPLTAMLSYSTGTSGSGVDVEKVAKARAIAKEKRSDLLIAGPVQYDAAIDPKVANLKMPGSKVAGNATVFVFPDLNTGNNTYKAVQRSTEGSLAIGPILQGLNKPVNDLSRGCNVADIVNTVAITAIQAHAGKNNK
ncbi:MAG: phosphate acetyltransferase [Desulfobacterales bacterium]|nr:phosphate acetyltransferase [Desulfobacterales bacterium]MCP4160677.1 phosphate acetyltransferase [Deltaproteobacteria bacterium]